jgi:hypothetical protein
LLILVRSLAMDYHLDKKLSLHLFTPGPLNGWDTEKSGVANSYNSADVLTAHSNHFAFPHT